MWTKHDWYITIHLDSIQTFGKHHFTNIMPGNFTCDYIDWIALL